jgi:uncharacterized protein (DUF2384 family)
MRDRLEIKGNINLLFSFASYHGYNVVDMWFLQGQHVSIKIREEIIVSAYNGVLSNLPEEDFLEFGLYDNVDYKKVTNFLEFDKNALSKISGVSKKSVRTDEKIPQALKDRLDEIAVICSLVAEHFSGDKFKTALWFKTPNPMLGGINPRDMIRLGRSNKLIAFIMEAKQANGEEQEQ